MTWLIAALFANSTRFFQQWSIAAWNMIFKVQRKSIKKTYSGGKGGGGGGGASAAANE